jgi:hypothetical protein
VKFGGGWGDHGMAVVPLALKVCSGLMRQAKTLGSFLFALFAFTHYDPRHSHARVPPGRGPAGGGQDKLGDARRQVDEVVDIMRDNMEKVLERDEKIGDLQDKSEDLLSRQIST